MTLSVKLEKYFGPALKNMSKTVDLYRPKMAVSIEKNIRFNRQTKISIMSSFGILSKIFTDSFSRFSKEKPGVFKEFIVKKSTSSG